MISVKQIVLSCWFVITDMSLLVVLSCTPQTCNSSTVCWEWFGSVDMKVLEKGSRSFGYAYWSAANRKVTVPLRVHFMCPSQAAAMSQPEEQTRWQMGPPQTLTLPTPHMPHLSTQTGLYLTPALSCCILIHHNNSWAHRVFDCLLTIRGHMFTSKRGCSTSTRIFCHSSCYTSCLV